MLYCNCQVVAFEPESQDTARDCWAVSFGKLNVVGVLLDY